MGFWARNIVYILYLMKKNVKIVTLDWKMNWRATIVLRSVCNTIYASKMVKTIHWIIYSFYSQMLWNINDRHLAIVIAIAMEKSLWISCFNGKCSITPTKYSQNKQKQMHKQFRQYYVSSAYHFDWFLSFFDSFIFPSFCSENIKHFNMITARLGALHFKVRFIPYYI